MKHTSKFLLIVALVATAASSVPVPSQARKSDLAPAANLQTTTPGVPTQERWWGAAAAMGCGFGIRYGAFTGAGALITAGFCVIALVDAIT